MRNLQDNRDAREASREATQRNQGELRATAGHFFGFQYRRKTPTGFTDLTIQWNARVTLTLVVLLVVAGLVAILGVLRSHGGDTSSGGGSAKVQTAAR
jgi:hypothetical protein